MSFDGAHLVALDAGLCEALRYQTLLVLEFGHDPFEDLRDLAPIDLLKLAATFREAFAVLDAVGWLPCSQPNSPVQVQIPARHLAQLERRRDDVLASRLDRLDSREGLTDPDAIAEADAALEVYRRTARGFVRLLQTVTRESWMPDPAGRLPAMYRSPRADLQPRAMAIVGERIRQRRLALGWTRTNSATEPEWPHPPSAPSSVAAAT